MTATRTSADLRGKKLYELATMIALDDAAVGYAAKPYLDAMGDLDSIDDAYGADSGETIVAYFLSNAGTYRGETARLVKAELKRRLAARS